MHENVTDIDDYAFAGCAAVKSITLPEGLTYIGAYAFAEMTALEEVYVPNTVTGVGEGLFADSDNVKVKCFDGNVVHEYVVANSIDFELVG